MTEKERNCLRGDVRSCRMEQRFLEFRPDGQLSRQTFLNPDGSELISSSDYDARGRILRVRSESGGELAGLQVYEYDPFGRLLRVVDRSPGHSERIVEAHDYEHDVHKKTTFIQIVPQHRDAVYFWSLDGSDSGYSVRGATQFTTRYSDAGQVVDVVFQNATGEVVSCAELRYDPAGQLFEEVLRTFDAGLPPELIAAAGPAQLDAIRACFEFGRTYRYDGHGRRIESRARIGPVGSDVRSTTYNAHGDPILEILVSEGRELGQSEDGELSIRPGSESVNRSESRFRYEYDAQGNWVLKIVEGIPEEQRRTIEYW